MFDGVYHVNHLSSERHKTTTEKISTFVVNQPRSSKILKRKPEIERKLEIKRKLASLVKRHFPSCQMTLDLFARGCEFDSCPGRTFLQRNFSRTSGDFRKRKILNPNRGISCFRYFFFTFREVVGSIPTRDDLVSQGTIRTRIG
uniref:Uncharacterized protein n=1 Tax=Cacopsylla melanoneura TaxID=428564 RepID=A0A8D8SU86_9HEMI